MCVICTRMVFLIFDQRLGILALLIYYKNTSDFMFTFVVLAVFDI
jgi:hypothetical protein